MYHRQGNTFDPARGEFRSGEKTRGIDAGESFLDAGEFFLVENQRGIDTGKFFLDAEAFFLVEKEHGIDAGELSLGEKSRGMALIRR